MEMTIYYLSNKMKPLLSLLFVVLLPGLYTVVEGAGPAMPKRLERREAAFRITFQGGDDSSFEKAVVIVGAKSSMDGVPAERKWLKKKYRGYEKLKQALVEKEGKYDDLVTIRTKKGRELVFYFDISEFFCREE